MFLLIRKSNLSIFFFLLVALTSCCNKSCPFQSCMEIPCSWKTSLQTESSQDPSCFHWWEELDDSLLTDLIDQATYKNLDVRLAAFEGKEKMGAAINSVSADIGKSYVELRGWQQRLVFLRESIEVQNNLIVAQEGLLNNGFISSINQNENKKMTETILAQISLIEFSINKSIFHLSALLGYAPTGLYDELISFQCFPKIPCNVLVESPCELIERHPDVQEARKLYEKAQNAQSFYNYQKKISAVLEQTEINLALLQSSLNKIHYLENSQKLKGESYQLIKDLHVRGMKDIQELQATYQEFLNSEIALVESRVELLTNYINLYEVLNVAWDTSCK